ncbi:MULTISPECIES: ABC transporter ATP-binding protein [unclassified Agrobacterium]|uniref:ABC transporter ATP-binding protein n=1 Tax=unclassified Agrobacterium TaxID=2632611 RepID=UPI0024474449|nr:MULTISPECIES: ABC transporter ATP-binding protein [unclassified Agrobacterium]MDH0615557.1 ABC transporter ATP-binding protein [Agrobacterium sp. GD03872]MDH0697521.1 ABC transporter ATP-binding protein [Agrobacterium sp. GD03871]MDH1060688.1 ABC transporter ATP-binding protein [Agrobacterium sp. GD03992]MDH2213315.1 ABC transporter ATP-binding protein [Agrobacterium sp. GD03643]MDH2221933.1 ABC transporter ATP-binding protein [Agrobacterium sp. GD03638]
MSELEISNISKDYGASRALHPVSITVERGEFVTILGPSGCGKSTLLRILTGISQPSGGEIHLGGKRIDQAPPEARDIAMVFQSYALFPHMSVAKNLGFGLKMKKVAKDERARRIAHALDICNLTGLVDRMPRQLSGGQQQRVALARAIVMQPSLLLFDEPLSNLDAKLRDTLRHELTELHRRIGATSLYVTHDQAEAMAMSDRIVVMNAGRVVEIGTPLELYRAPKHAFTAGFLGQTNLLPVSADGQQAELPWGQLVTLDRAATGNVQISVRPENIHIRADQAGEGTVSAVSFMGANALYTVEIGGRQIRVSQSGAETLIDAGQRVALQFPGSVHLLDDRMAGEAA